MLKSICRVLPLSFLLMAGAAHAASERMQVCFRYGCKSSAYVAVSADTRMQLQQLFQTIDSPAAERAAIREAVRQLYLNAGSQSPIYQDKGGNFRDGTAEGRMDCVDHSSNTTTFLNYLAAQGRLKFHTVGKPVYRLPRIIDLHYAAQLVETGSGEKWVVDSWFEDFGAAPAVVEYVRWKKGWRPQ